MHSLLEASPLTAALLLTALHWDQAVALAGHGGRPRFRLRLKHRHPLPPVRAGLLAAVGIAGVLPYAEEFWRCWRAHPTASRGRGLPSQPRKHYRSRRTAVPPRRARTPPAPLRPGRRHEPRKSRAGWRFASDTSGGGCLPA